MDSPPAVRARGIKAQLSLFLDGALLSYLALFRWFRPTTYVASKIAMPLWQMIFFTLIGKFAAAEDSSFYVVGNAMQIAAVSGIFGVTMSIGGDRWTGTLPYVFGTPANRMVLFFGRASVHLLDGVVGVVIAFAWGALLFGLPLADLNISGLALSVVAVVFSTSGLGLLMGCVGLITRNIMFVNNTVYFVLLALSGANVPLAAMPAWLRPVSDILPLTAGIRAARLSFVGAQADELLPFLVKELAVGGAYLLAGFFLFRGFERAAKKRGSLETM